MKKDNVEALKSSVMLGVAFGASSGGSLFLTGNPHWVCFGLMSVVAGTLLGLLTTWYPDEE